MAKSKYESHVLPRLDDVKRWAGEGLSNKQIAGNLGISEDSLYEYTKKHAVFSECLARAKNVADVEVENALYKLALGYTTEVAKNFKVKRVEFDPETGRKVAEREELVMGFDQVNVPANVQAQQFWLTRRWPTRWPYKPEGSEEEPGGGVVILPEVVNE